MPNAVQIIETPAGEKMAIMPLGEYQRLRRLAGDSDAREANAILARVKAGKTRLVPHEVVKAIAIDGVHPVRAFRENRNWTATELAKKTRLARTTITQIETRRRAGTIAAYSALAKALDVDVDTLLEHP